LRAAILAHNAQAGDAVGNQVAEEVAFFAARGADVRVFLESDRRLHPHVRGRHCVVPGGEPAAPAWDFLCSADLVIVEYSQSYPLLQVLPALAEQRPRILLNYHSITPVETWRGPKREALEEGVQQRGLVWCADAAVAHSRFTWEELRRCSGFPAERLFRLGLPLDIERFSPGAPGCHLKEQLGLGSATLLLFVGRLAPNKRVPVLIEALAQLRDLTPRVHAAVIGDDSDVYQLEARHCRQRAEELGVADRLHLFGHVSEARLLDAYRSADVFVMPSCHEGFCLPVIEAMGCGVPVVAARAGALPETVGPAGITCAPDDAGDLARQVRRVLESHTAPTRRPGPRRVAVVAFRYGDGFAGGAETSLRTIATTLREAGCEVEVFTTCTRDESHWSNRLAEGTAEVDGIAVHRFRIDRLNHRRHDEAVRAVLEADGAIPEAVETEYLAHSIHSGRLLDALARRLDELDAVITGPYLHGLTLDVVRRFPEKTLLLPCLHDEPFARLRAVREAFEGVGGVLYHSPEEQELAQAGLGFNHPGAWCCGTRIDTAAGGDADRGRALVGAGRRYMLYCGRYSPSKALPTLLDHARRYAAEHPDRFRFAFAGQGDISIPAEPWARDLGFVDEPTRRDLMAGADLLIQLSPFESLSLVALEAWAQGVPVLASAGCAVLSGHLDRCGAGRAVADYATFAAALDDLWQRPEHWQALGRQGRAYVRASYGSAETYAAVLLEAVDDLGRPLVERMRRQGRQQAARHAREAWTEQFARLVEGVLDGPGRPFRLDVEVRPRGNERRVPAGLGQILWPVQVHNRGTHAVTGKGPAAVIIRWRVVGAGVPEDVPTTGVVLPGLLTPQRSLAMAVPVMAPGEPGDYRLLLWAEVAASAGVDGSAEEQAREQGNGMRPAGPVAEVRLVVEEGSGRPAESSCAPLLAGVESALAEAHQLQRLPQDYVDVTEGRFARCKRWLKRKLLGNFKHAYVDVLSRQQSAFNQRILAAVHELAEYVATLEHAVELQRGSLEAPAARVISDTSEKR
jgi:glycosyltransferase involved in cell wall biosynthesis